MLVRIFYLRCICQAYIMDSLKDIKYFLESILIIALSKNIECTMDGKLLMSNERMEYLNNIIKGNVDNFTEIDTHVNDNDDDSEIESFCNESSHEENCNTSWMK